MPAAVDLEQCLLKVLGERRKLWHSLAGHSQKLSVGSLWSTVPATSIAMLMFCPTFHVNNVAGKKNWKNLQQKQLSWLLKFSRKTIVMNFGAGHLHVHQRSCAHCNRLTLVYIPFYPVVDQLIRAPCSFTNQEFHFNEWP